MTDQPQTARPDARLVRLHAERGDPHARLAGALADLEGAGWGLLLRDEAALARQLTAAVGAGTLRVDARIRLHREALAAAGLAAAALDADWRGARAVWLLEPSAADLDRARRAGVPVIVDATLAPGGTWLAQGAALVTYRASVTLTGHGDAPLSALFGAGQAPQPAAAPPSDLSVALALRDVATLPLRLARVARTVTQLAERLGGAAQPAGPTALLLAPDAAADTEAPLGGVLAAACSVPGGVLLSPGLEEAGAALALLRAAERPAEVAPPAREPEPESREPRESDDRREFRGDRRPGRERFDRRDRRDGDGRGNDARGSDGRGSDGRSFDGRGGTRGRFERRGERPEQPGAPSRPDVPERFAFEPPQETHPAAPSAQAPAPVAAQGPLSPAEETWEPEIVFSDSPSPDHAPLPIPVSSGPDAPVLEQVPDVDHQALEDQAADAGEVQEAPAEEAGASEPLPAPEPEPAPVILAPDLPGGKEDPAANLTDEQAAVYARLREWRNAEAKRQEISRFIIASNATLAEIARRVPYTLDDLRAVRGMGPERLRKYGDKLLEVVRG
ncbi:HRDC domain-containing protein [Deinococcus taeanensis]|uniref:HRDC domain-containing protein n=1 Tax=Deinococcus taeanensis TaxID=2737050 RepID=UPI001CDBF63C|nr:HRDC domain-containing protein [Deinococcus taeanensis]UBV42935.1 HRDC domain-containing protein [Deinococcus taeanensis]